ncbi:hypothetical protein M501DRAFT_1032861 [Patellaria atrata CBS 101060]|uniref:Uncharacterized protein n=1 Tax=Patellaria atrata CBS 101060 TaxID=1346257 RepID=A0A9P4S7N9_9PEZI|nr:hypothetical protein M501DRAFT_1032861 [Patellaria atrata CBS 101060]
MSNSPETVDVPKVPQVHQISDEVKAKRAAFFEKHGQHIILAVFCSGEKLRPDFKLLSQELNNAPKSAQNKTITVNNELEKFRHEYGLVFAEKAPKGEASPKKAAAPRKAKVTPEAVDAVNGDAIERDDDEEPTPKNPVTSLKRKTAAKKVEDVDTNANDADAEATPKKVATPRKRKTAAKKVEDSETNIADVDGVATLKKAATPRKRRSTTGTGGESPTKKGRGPAKKADPKVKEDADAEVGVDANVVPSVEGVDGEVKVNDDAEIDGEEAI